MLHPIALLGLRYDACSSFQAGAAEAPTFIRSALRSEHGNAWTELGIDTATPGLVYDGGDLPLNAVNDPADAMERIERWVAAHLEAGYRPLSLGGDHAVTVGAVRAVSRFHRRALTVVQVDAHPDLYPEYGGSPYSHACTAARIMEERLATRLVQIGVRTMNDVQRRQADRWGVEVIEMRRWMGAVPDVTGDVYLTIDVDAIDPGLAPGVSHREPGGLTVRDVIGIIHAVSGRLVGADLVEFNPRNDPAFVTEAVCGKLAKELIGALAA